MPQKLGQHFLKDAGWRAKILHALEARAGEVWLEIGAGHGEMTRELARTARKVLAIEVDEGLRETLQQVAAEHPNVQIVRGDVLQLDLAQILGVRGEGRGASSAQGEKERGDETRINERVRVYGSLPYYITSPILRRLFEHADQIQSIAVVIQREVAERVTAQPHSRDYGFLSVLCQYYAEPEIVLELPPGAFSPPPKVASALVRMRLPGQRAKLGIRDSAAFEKFLQACFAQKRKTLLNNLKAVVTPPQAVTAIAAAGLAPKARAEELTLTEFARLFEAIGQRT